MTFAHVYNKIQNGPLDGLCVGVKSTLDPCPQ